MKKLITYSLFVLMGLFLSFQSFSLHEGKNKANVNANFVQKIYPNPAYKGNLINVNLKLPEKATVDFIVLDMIGNKQIDVSKDLKKGSQAVFFDTDNLSSGVYFLNVIYNDKKQVQRLIIR